MDFERICKGPLLDGNLLNHPSRLSLYILFSLISITYFNIILEKTDNVKRKVIFFVMVY